MREQNFHGEYRKQKFGESVIVVTLAFPKDQFHPKIY